VSSTETIIEMPCVPASLGPSGPRACLASLDDHRLGRLTGQWIGLDASPAKVESVARAILRRASSAEQGLGVFDIEGASLDDAAVQALLAPVLGSAGRWLLSS
jgi:hypothetical protein